MNERGARTPFRTGGTTPLRARSDGAASSSRRGGLWARLRELADNQLRLWDSALDDLRPWEQEGSLRWRGTRLEGATVPTNALATQVDRVAHQ